MSCIFCESVFADPVLPHNRQKICLLFNVSFNGKKLLHDGKICSRCHVQVDLIENAMKLKSEMSQCLQDKLGGNEERLSTAGSATHTSTISQLTSDRSIIGLMWQVEWLYYVLYGDFENKGINILDFYLH